MAQLAIKNLSKLAPFAGGPWDLPHKFHLYLIIPLRAKRVGEFIEIRHKKILPTHKILNDSDQKISTLANFQLFSSHLVCIDGPIGH